DNIGSLSPATEEKLTNILLKNHKNGEKKNNFVTILELANLKELWEEVSKYKNNRGMENITLGMALVAFDNILGDIKGKPHFIDHLAKVLPTLDSRFKTSKYTSSHEDYRVD